MYASLTLAAASATRDSVRCSVTTESLTSRLAPCAKLPTLASLSAVAASGSWKLGVDDTTAGARQSMMGFGAAWTDATVTVFDSLDVSAQDELLEQLFGETGIRLAVMRHTIGQSDLTPSALGRWSFDEAGGAPDPNLTQFNLTDPGRRMLGWLKRMHAKNSDVTLFGSPWSPPGWMKQDNTLQTKYIDAWVEYMLRYLREYREAGVHVSAVTPQNEPLHSADPAWTMSLDKTYQALLVKKLGAALRSAGEETAIWVFDHNTDHPEVPQYILDNAGEFVGGVAWHCYGAFLFGDSWAPMSKFHTQNPTVPQFMTECWTHLDSGEGFFDLPSFIGSPVRNYGQAALAWTLGGSVDYDVSYPGGCGQCSGIVQVNMSDGSAHLTQDYYSLGQFSKFVERNATYHTSNGSYIYHDNTGVQATAFVNPDGARVVVIENKIHDDLDMQVSFGSGDVWVGQTPARSISTWVLPPKHDGNAVYEAFQHATYGPPAAGSLHDALMVEARRQ